MSLKVKRWSGVTMIELMVVVMMIGILGVLGLTNMWTQQGKAHDANRKKDLDRLRIAMLNYNADKTCFPDPADVTCGSNKLQPYLDEVPCETNGSSFYYERPSCDKFIAYTRLEYANDPSIREKGCLAGCGPDFSYNYYVQDGMTLKVDFNGAPSGDVPGLKPVRPLCGTQVKYCYNNICSSCCPGSKYRCDNTGEWCIPDRSCGN